MKKTGIILILFAFAFSSCNEEEFYVKDSLETFTDINNPNNTNPNNPNNPNPNNPNPNNPNPNNPNPNNPNPNNPNPNNPNPNNPNPSRRNVVNNFQQIEDNKKVDILWVVDNSGSMADEQEAIARNFDVFIQDFVTKDIDFKMAIATTDNDGNPVVGSEQALTRDMMNSNPAQFIADFKDMIKVGIRGSGHEQPFKSIARYIEQHAPSNFREDAQLAVIIVSDEHEQSPLPTEIYMRTILNWKNDISLVKAYGIVNMSETYSFGHARFAQVTAATNGYLQPITEDFFSTLSRIGQDVANLAFSFPLSETLVHLNSLEVYVDNSLQTTGWSFDSVSNAVVFDQVSAPAPGSAIQVKYEVDQ